MFRLAFLLLLSGRMVYGQGSCEDGFNMVADTHTEGGVCVDEAVTDLEECLCWCQNEETCSAVDWNKSDNPYNGCRCWWFSGNSIQKLTPKTNMRADQWTKQPNENPESAAEWSGCDIVHGYGYDYDGDRQRELIGKAESKEECASQVFTQYPDATSMTYFGESKNCLADFNTEYIYDYFGEDYLEYSCMNPKIFPDQKIVQG